jgi:hypothetical protein
MITTKCSLFSVYTGNYINNINNPLLSSDKNNKVIIQKFFFESKKEVIVPCKIIIRDYSVNDNLNAD